MIFDNPNLDVKDYEQFFYLKYRDTMIKYFPNSVTVYPNTVRLNIHLNEPDDSSFNSLSYPRLVNLELGKDTTSSDTVGLTTEDTFDRFKDYEEESYIDNTEVFRDTLPAGKEPEFGGFYVNTGKLKLKTNLAVSKSVDKKKREKKKFSAKTKVVQTKTVRKKESTRPEVKKSKHENPKISVSHKMYSNIRLDSLLNTVRKQKKNGTVKNIKMPSTPKRSSVTGGSKKPKEFSKIEQKKKATSKKCANTSKSGKVILNSIEVTIPRDDFLSTKTAPFHSHSSTSDSDEIEVVKEIVHSLYKNNNEHNFVKDNLTLKTAVTSERDQVSTFIDLSNKIASESTTKSKLPCVMAIPSNPCKANISEEDFTKISRTSDLMRSIQSTSSTIPKEPSRSCPQSTFVSSSSILDTKKTSPNSCHTTEPINVFQAPQIAVDPDFISITPVLKATKPTSPFNPTIPWNSNSNRKLTANYASTANVPMRNSDVSLSYSDATVPMEVLHSSRKISPNSSSIACSPMLNTVVVSSTSKATIPKGESHSCFKYATEYAPFQDNLQAMSERNLAKATVKMVQSSTSKANITPVHSSYANATITPIKSSTSKATITPVHSSHANATITPIQSSSSKATLEPKPSSASKATISPVHSNSSKTAPVHSSYFKTKPADSRSSKRASMPGYSRSSKLASMPAYSSSSKPDSMPVHSISYSMGTSMPVHSSSSKATISPIHSNYSKATIAPLQSSSSKVTIRREMLNPSCEFSIPTSCTLVNNQDSYLANNWECLTANSTNAKAVSKYMLDVIHNESSNSTSNSMSTFPFNSPDNFFFCGNNLPFNNSYRTYSKASKNSFQPIVKTTAVVTSSVTVSQTKQTTVMNSVNSSYDTTSVNMYKMNISPVVKCKEPLGKF